MKKLLVFLTMVVFSLGLMSACPEKKEEGAPTSDTETMEKKTDEDTTTEEGTKEEADDDAMNDTDTDAQDTATAN